MTSDCARLHEVAPELALGVLVGAERGHALAHLALCAECRHFVDEMAEVADSLLLLAAEAEPPVGFESRVVARLAAEHPRRHPWRWIAAVAAAIVLAAVATGIAVHHHDGRVSDLHMRTAELLTATGKESGDVYVMEGQPARVIMSISSRRPGEATCASSTSETGALSAPGSSRFPMPRAGGG